jgi:undecaprenyl-diphosphatase
MHGDDDTGPSASAPRGNDGSAPHERVAAGAPGGPARWLRDAERVDVALYAAIAQTPTPALDRAMARLSHAADYSRLSLSAAAVLALAGGARGRRAALDGLVSIGVTATVVNLVAKPLGRRSRPDRVARHVPVARHVRMPLSTSFPSGHSAAAFAFATGVGRTLPPAAVPLRGLAAAVAYSRVHTGVHYPGDVVAGALMGTALSQLATHALERRAARHG